MHCCVNALDMALKESGCKAEKGEKKKGDY